MIFPPLKNSFLVSSLFFLLVGVLKREEKKERKQNKPMSIPAKVLIHKHFKFQIY